MPDTIDAPDPASLSVSTPSVGESRSPPVTRPPDVMTEPVGWGLKDGTPVPDVTNSPDPVERPVPLTPVRELRPPPKVCP